MLLRKRGLLDIGSPARPRGASASRRDIMIVAVGFNPRTTPPTMNRVAERRMKPGATPRDVTASTVAPRRGMLDTPRTGR